MIFSRTKIEKALKAKIISIKPFSKKNLGVASYNLTLDLSQPLTLKKGEFIVLKTLEKLTLSPSVACLISTRGSAAIKGISASQSAFFCEPDTANHINLEISNSSGKSVILSPGMSIAKAIFVGVI